MANKATKTLWEVYGLEIETKLSELPNFLGNQQVYDLLLEENPSVKIFLDVIKHPNAEEFDNPADRWIVVVYENNGIFSQITGANISINASSVISADQTTLAVHKFQTLSNEMKMAFASVVANPKDEIFNDYLEVNGSDTVNFTFVSENFEFRNTVVTIAAEILEKGGELC